MQDEMSIKDMIIPQNFMLVWSKVGGFLAITSKLLGQLVGSYANFAFKKSAIKKLYFYSRTRKKEGNSKVSEFTASYFKEDN